MVGARSIRIESAACVSVSEITWPTPERLVRSPSVQSTDDDHVAHLGRGLGTRLRMYIAQSGARREVGAMTTDAVTYRPVGHPITSWTDESKRDRERRAELRARGICTGCGKRRTRGKALCKTCRKRNLEVQRRLRETRKAAGDCQECGEHAAFKTRCPACVARRNLRRSRQRAHRAPEYEASHRRDRKRRAAWRKRGLCIDCGEPRDPAGGTRCPYHRAKYQAAVQRAAEIQRAERIAEVAEFEARCGATTVAEAAAIIGVCSHRVSELCIAGIIPWGKLGALRRLKIDDVMTYKAHRDAHPERQRTQRKAAT